MWPARGTEMCGLRVRQCLVVEFASGFGIGCGVGGMFVQNIWFFVFLHARRLIASNEDRQLPFRAEAAQCLQSRGRVCSRRLVACPNRDAGFPLPRNSKLRGILSLTAKE